jgi:hypothetical protein
MATLRIKLPAGLIAAFVAAWSPSYAEGESAGALASVQVQAPAVTVPAQTPVAQSPRAAARPPVRHPPHRSADDVLNERVEAVSQALKLDGKQKIELRAILLSGRDQLRQVWSDTTRTSAERIGMSQSINQQTEDRIRSILSDEQRNKYIAPKPAGKPAERPEHDLEFWMDQTRGAQ